MHSTSQVLNLKPQLVKTCCNVATKHLAIETLDGSYVKTNSCCILSRVVNKY